MLPSSKLFLLDLSQGFTITALSSGHSLLKSACLLNGSRSNGKSASLLPRLPSLGWVLHIAAASVSRASRLAFLEAFLGARK